MPLAEAAPVPPSAYVGPIPVGGSDVEVGAAVLPGGGVAEALADTDRASLAAVCSAVPA